MNIDWTLLGDRNIEYEEVNKLAIQVDLVMTDELFDEILTLNTLLEKIANEML